MKKLIPAFALLLVSAVLMSTASFAWFSMNNTVTVTGMEIKTKVGDSLLIAPDTLNSTAKLDDSYFVRDITQTVKGILEPTSTINGKDFFYTSTNNAKASGDAITDSYIDYDAVGLGDAEDTTTYGNAFSQNYLIDKATASAYNEPSSNVALGYIDYVFQLKAMNTTANPLTVDLTKLSLIYGDATKDVSKAYRVAIFVEDITSGTATNGTLPAGPAGTAVIYTPYDSSNFTAGNAVATTAALNTVTYATTATPLDTLTAGETAYYKVVVRLWLEGEDTTCNNSTFMTLTNTWKLDLEMKLGATGVTHIQKYISDGTYYFDGQYAWTDRSKLSEASTDRVNGLTTAAVVGAYGLTAGEYSITAANYATTSTAVGGKYVVDGLKYAATGEQLYSDNASATLTTSDKLYVVRDGTAIEVTAAYTLG